MISAVADIVVIIFQKGKLNRILVGDIEKKRFNAYRPLNIKRKKVEVKKKKKKNCQATDPLQK